jgi:hypothetical protein
MSSNEREGIEMLRNGMTAPSEGLQASSQIQFLELNRKVDSLGRLVMLVTIQG